MRQNEMAEVMERVFHEEIMALRDAGQKEYAHEGADSFANFDRLAEDLKIDRKQVLWVYAMKHRDGIASWLKGHKSQREDVTGRINDLIVYLFLLRGMIEEEKLLNAKYAPDAVSISVADLKPGKVEEAPTVEDMLPLQIRFD